MNQVTLASDLVAHVIGKFQFLRTDVSLIVVTNSVRVRNVPKIGEHVCCLPTDKQMVRAVNDRLSEHSGREPVWPSGKALCW